MYCEYGYRDFFSVKKPIRSVAESDGRPSPHDGFRR